MAFIDATGLHQMTRFIGTAEFWLPGNGRCDGPSLQRLRGPGRDHRWWKLWRSRMTNSTVFALPDVLAAEETPLWIWPIWMVLWGGFAWLIIRRFRRWRRSRPAVHAQPPDSSWLRRPAPGQIWWTEVPFSDGTGSKVRPCLVVRTHASLVEVLKITSQDKSNRWDHVAIPTANWDRHAWKDSWVDLSRTYFLADHAFRKPASDTCDAWVWDQVTRRHATGWVYEAMASHRVV
jgi:hypothetical protein